MTSSLSRLRATLRATVGRLFGLARTTELERRLDAEMQFHLDQLTTRNIERGMAPGEARRAALVTLGGRQRHAESARDEYRSRMADSFARDVRYALRSLRRSPAFTAAVVLSLAIGIGATSAIFTVVERVVLRPLPYGTDGGGTLVMLWSTPTKTPSEHDVVSYGDYLDWVHQSHTIQRSAAFNIWYPSLTGHGDAEVLGGSVVDADFFRVLDVAPLLGRTFRADEDVPGGPRVAVIAHSLWQRRFGGDPHIVGRTITLDGSPYTVIGVMAADFRDPEPLLKKTAEVWRPLSRAIDASARTVRYLRVVARLRPGVSVRAAQRELGTIGARLAKAYPVQDSAYTVSAVPMEDQVVGASRPALFAALAGAACLLLIVCGNVATLVVARHANRTGELAVRSAMGAGRARLARMLVMESVLLAVVGASLGLALAAGAVAMLRHAAPPDLPRANEIALDVRVVIVTAAIALVASVLFGLVPALRAARTDLTSVLHAATRRTTVRTRLRNAIIVAQFALSLVLLVGAGLLARTLERLDAVPLGFAPDHVLTAHVNPTTRRYPTDTADRAFLRTLTTRLEAIRGVEAVGMAVSLPLSKLNDMQALVPATRSAANDSRQWSAVHYRPVTPGYRRAMGVRLIAGRDFTDADSAGREPVVILNRTAAAKFFPHQNPIGAQFVEDTSKDGAARVVGVVDDVRFESPAEPPAPEMFVPQAQQTWADVAVVMRVAGDPGRYIPAMRDAVRSIDPDLPLSDVQPMSTLVSSFTARQRFYALLFASFALTALVLSAIGVYGVIAYLVANQRLEIGLRMALGAEPGTVLGQLMRRVGVLTAIGAAIGIVAAIAGSRAIQSLLYGVSPADLTTLVGAVAALTVIALGAALRPALRAMRISPATALRGE